MMTDTARQPRRQSTAPMRDLALLSLADHPYAAAFPEADALGFRACDPADAMLPGRRYIDDAGELRRFEADECWRGVVRLECVVHSE